MASKKRKQDNQAPGWAWMMFGLSIGLSVALVVFLKSGGPEIPSSYLPESPVAAARSAPAPVPETETATATATAPERTVAAAPEEEGPSEFGFFSRLPELEVIVPQGEFSERTANRPPTRYVIQAGSFRSHEEADGQQATLAFLAIEAHIETVRIEDQTWHRVIVGPLDERGEVNRAMRILRDARIDPLLRPLSD